ncbi:MAG: hypothetical protein QMB92_00110 [Thiopseudomonas sp.]
MSSLSQLMHYHRIRSCDVELDFVFEIRRQQTVHFDEQLTALPLGFLL